MMAIIIFKFSTSVFSRFRWSKSRFTYRLASQ